MNKKRLRTLLAFVMAAALFCAACIIASDVYDWWHARNMQQSLKALYPLVSGRILFPAEAAAEEFFESEDFPEIELFPDEPLKPGKAAEDTDDETLFPEPVFQEDFSALYDVNPDVVGWLTAGENIDYPVVLRDNEYYLERNFYQKQDSNGALFLNEANSIWPKDTVMLIHGHAMRGRAMFGDLRRFKDEAYFRIYPVVTFRTIYDEEPVSYVPVAAFDASMDEKDKWYFDLTRLSFETPEDYETYLTEIRERAYWQSPFDVNIEDRLVVLVTCSYIQTNGRFMLFCRELRENETVDSVHGTLNTSW